MFTSKCNFIKVISCYSRICFSTSSLAGKKRSALVSSGLVPRKVSKYRHFCSLNREQISFDNESQNRKNGSGGNDLLRDINVSDIVGSDEALLKKLKVLVLEIDVMRQDGYSIPNKISVERWKELLSAPTRSQRIKILSFLFKNQMKKESDLRKKQERKKQNEVHSAELKKARDENPHINYGFGGCTIFLRVYDTKIDEFYNSKVINAMKFGQDLVLDCSYDKFMNPKEASLCAKQMMIMFSENRKHPDPYNLHFCNSVPEMKTMSKLSHMIPTLYNRDFPLNITEKSYLDLFPKERLVYLTPHCREELTTYSHDDVYIIGGMVDKVNNDQISLGIAKREGLRMAKLPLDRHLLWHIGTKSLTLNQMLLIMLEMKASGDWSKAFKHVPKRKILDQNDVNIRPTKGPPLYRQQFKKLNLSF